MDEPRDDFLPCARVTLQEHRRLGCGDLRRACEDFLPRRGLADDVPATERRAVQSLGNRPHARRAAGRIRVRVCVPTLGVDQRPV